MGRNEIMRAILGLKPGEEARERDPNPVTIHAPGGKPGRRECACGAYLGLSYLVGEGAVLYGECQNCKWERRVAEARAK